MNTQPEVSAHTKALVAWFEHLKATDVAHMGAHYDTTVFFKDPFNEVTDLASVQAIFHEMFKRVQHPRFIVHDVLEQGASCFLTWDFTFETGSPQPWCIRGASHLRFNTEGRVVYHRDYWDAAEELYEKLPVIGSLMRWLKRRVG